LQTICKQNSSLQYARRLLTKVFGKIKEQIRHKSGYAFKLLLEAEMKFLSMNNQVNLKSETIK